MKRAPGRYTGERTPKPSALMSTASVEATKRSVITDLFDLALRNARRTGTDRRVKLKNGAEIVIRARDGWITVTFKRQGAKVGTTEELTFMRDCRVPVGATRIPEAGQSSRSGGPRTADTWHYFGFTWPDPEAPA